MTNTTKGALDQVTAEALLKQVNQIASENTRAQREFTNVSNKIITCAVAEIRALIGHPAPASDARQPGRPELARRVVEFFDENDPFGDKFCRNDVKLIEAAIASDSEIIETMTAALKSIANNTCCEGCQEAKLVARRAMAALHSVSVSSTDEIKPHIYSPDYQAMGDCRVCGHMQDVPWHYVTSNERDGK